MRQLHNETAVRQCEKPIIAKLFNVVQLNIPSVFCARCLLLCENVATSSPQVIRFLCRNWFM